MNKLGKKKTERELQYGRIFGVRSKRGPPCNELGPADVLHIFVTSKTRTLGYNDTIALATDPVISS